MLYERMEPVKDLINSLEKDLDSLGLDLFQTGSRFFGNHGIDSDYDFFVQNDVKLTTKFFTDRGFELQYFSTYDDSETLTVYKHATHPIHLQIVKSAEHKWNMQICFFDILHSSSRLTKSERRNLWDKCFKAYYATLELYQK